MVGRWCPYRAVSAVVKSNRPLGVAVMALLSKYLQCIYRRRVWQNHATATAAGGDEEGA